MAEEKRRAELDRLVGLSDAELNEEAARLKESIFRLNFKLALGDVDAVRTARRDKRTLARVKTLIRQRALAQPATE